MSAADAIVALGTGSSTIPIITGNLTVNGNLRVVSAEDQAIFSKNIVTNDINTGNDITCIGLGSGASLTTGDFCVFLGQNTGSLVTTSGGNILIGGGSGQNLDHLHAGNNSDNVAIGRSTLFNAQTGTAAAQSDGNTCCGTRSLENLISGSTNVAIGYECLANETSGLSLLNGSGNIALGAQTVLKTTPTQTDVQLISDQFAISTNITSLSFPGLGTGLDYGCTTAGTLTHNGYGLPITHPISTGQYLRSSSTSASVWGALPNIAIVPLSGKYTATTGDALVNAGYTYLTGSGITLDADTHTIHFPAVVGLNYKITLRPVWNIAGVANAYSTATISATNATLSVTAINSSQIYDSSGGTAYEAVGVPSVHYLTTTTTAASMVVIITSVGAAADSGFGTPPDNTKYYSYLEFELL